MRVGYVEGLADAHGMIMKATADQQPDVCLGELADLDGDSLLAKWYLSNYEEAIKHAPQVVANVMAMRKVVWKGPKVSTHTPTPKKKIRRLSNAAGQGLSLTEARQWIETTGGNSPKGSSS